MHLGLSVFRQFLKIADSIITFYVGISRFIPQKNREFISFHNILLGNKFKIITKHEPIAYDSPQNMGQSQRTLLEMNHPDASIRGIRPWLPFSKRCKQRGIRPLKK